MRAGRNAGTDYVGPRVRDWRGLAVTAGLLLLLLLLLLFLTHFEVLVTKLDEFSTPSQLFLALCSA